MEFTSPSGYVTLVKPDGSGLIFSTFFSGSKTDTVSFAALTSICRSGWNDFSGRITPAHRLDLFPDIWAATHQTWEVLGCGAK